MRPITTIEREMRRILLKYNLKRLEAKYRWSAYDVGGQKLVQGTSSKWIAQRKLFLFVHATTPKDETARSNIAIYHELREIAKFDGDLVRTETEYTFEVTLPSTAHERMEWIRDQKMIEPKEHVERN